MSLRDDLRKVLGIKDVTPKMAAKPPVLGGVGMARVTIPSGEYEDGQPICYPALIFDEKGNPQGTAARIIDSLIEVNSGRRVRLFLDGGAIACEDAIESDKGFYVLKELRRFRVDKMPDDFWSDSGFSYSSSRGIIQYPKERNDQISPMWSEGQRNTAYFDYDATKGNEPATDLGFGVVLEDPFIDGVFFGSIGLKKGEESMSIIYEAIKEITAYLKKKVKDRSKFDDYFLSTGQYIKLPYSIEVDAEGHAGLENHDVNAKMVNTRRLQPGIVESSNPPFVKSYDDGGHEIRWRYYTESEKKRTITGKADRSFYNSYHVQEIKLSANKIEFPYPDGSYDYNVPERWAAMRIVLNRANYEPGQFFKKCFLLTNDKDAIAESSGVVQEGYYKILYVVAADRYPPDEWREKTWPPYPEPGHNAMWHQPGLEAYVSEIRAEDKDKLERGIKSYIYEFKSYFDQFVIDLKFNAETELFEGSHPEDNSFVPPGLMSVGDLDLMDEHGNRYRLEKIPEGFYLHAGDKKYKIDNEKYEVIADE